MLEPPPGNLTPACFMWRRTIMEIAKPLSGWKGVWHSGRPPNGVVAGAYRLSLSIAASTRSKAESSSLPGLWATRHADSLGG